MSCIDLFTGWVYVGCILPHNVVPSGRRRYGVTLPTMLGDLKTLIGNSMEGVDILDPSLSTVTIRSLYRPELYVY